MHAEFFVQSLWVFGACSIIRGIFGITHTIVLAITVDGQQQQDNNKRERQRDSQSPTHIDCKNPTDLSNPPNSAEIEVGKSEELKEGARPALSPAAGQSTTTKFGAIGGVFGVTLIIGPYLGSRIGKPSIKIQMMKAVSSLANVKCNI